MSKLLCACGAVLSDGAIPNTTEFHACLDTELHDIWDRLDKILESENLQNKWRALREAASPYINIWRCYHCKRLYILRKYESHHLSPLYHPDELLWKESTLTLSTLLADFPWQPTREKGADFQLDYKPINYDPSELTKNQLWTQVFPLASDPVCWDVWVTALPDGGLLSYGENGGWFKHYLYNHESFSTALKMLDLQTQQIRQLRLWAWAKSKATSDDDLDTFFQRHPATPGESMTTPPLRPRAAALIFNNQNQILLMLRRKNGKHYATLPGGGIEPGETPAQAAAREVLEEVNLTVTVGEQVLEMDNLTSHEHYFLCKVVSGEMRLGDGPEGIRQSEENHYEPQWIDVAQLDEVNLVPEVLRGLARQLLPQRG